VTAGRKGGGGRPLLQAPMPKVVLWECMRVGLLISVWVAAPGWVGKVEERQGHRRVMCVCYHGPWVQSGHMGPLPFPCPLNGHNGLN
jgi:hypothetical protein